MVDAAACSRNSLPRNDDGSGPRVDLPFEVNFYGQTHDHVFVNNNGNVTFDQALSTFTPFGLKDTSRAIIAPFFADVDTRPTGSDVVRYGYGTTVYEGHEAFCVDWRNVGYYNGKTDKLNSFQLLLVARPDQGRGAFDIVFNYDGVQWETGDASGGRNGLGGTPARIGFASGRPGGTSEQPSTRPGTELPGSGESGAFLDSSPNGLVHSSLGSSVPGRYVFKVRNQGVVADKYVALGDSFQSGEGSYLYEDGTGAFGGCHRSTLAYPKVLASTTVRLDLDFEACSGAKMGDLVSTFKSENPQIDSLGYDTRLVTIGIGGNDLDFSGTLKNCIVQGLNPLNTFGPSCQKNFGADVDRNLTSLEKGKLRTDLVSLYRVVRAKAPYARVVVVSYPRFFNQSNFLNQNCQFIRGSDQKWINSSIDRADAAIGRAAQQVGFEHVNMADVLTLQDACAPAPAINGILFTAQHKGADNESFHPNPLGHARMAARIQSQLATITRPTYDILPGQTVVRKFTVSGRTVSVNVAWPGSDVETTLISPSGVRYTRSEPREADHANGPTYEYFTVPDAEAGEWTISSYGLDVAPEGEPVTLSTYEEEVLAPLPVAVVRTSGTGRTLSFDGTGSSVVGGRVVRYEWDFGDGTTGEGATVEHTFAEPGLYQVALVVTDDRGGVGFGATEGPVAAEDATPMRRSGVVRSASNLTITNSTSLVGPAADAVVDGDFTCDSRGHVGGDVIATGSVTLTNDCSVDGSITAGGTVRMDSNVRVGGDVTASGQVTVQSSVRVGGDVATADTLQVMDGRTVEQLRSIGSITGVVTERKALPPVVVPPVDELVAGSAPATDLSWGQWLKATAQANQAPSWSQGLSANPGCTLASWSAGGNVVSTAGATRIDATRAVSGCSSVSLQDQTLRLEGDLTIVAEGLTSTNGLRVVSADGAAHTLRIVVPGTLDGCATGRDIALVGPTTADDQVTVRLETPGRVRLDGQTDLRGAVVTGCLSATGAVTLRTV
ncbi:nidogen-like domain-containing protein [Kineococcus sp. TBRC 1896]|uniref:Nidogen-like domain-containing protein n=1 Tax=Kineococcus mangrovi TaxID=1660183 RepID=A0ABV4I1H6_9ACTN